MFIFDLTYTPSPELESQLAAHRAFLDKYYAAGKLICSGRKEPWTGGIIVCRAKNLEEATAIAHEDPFYTNGLAECRIIQFDPSKFAADFEKLI